MLGDDVEDALGAYLEGYERAADLKWVGESHQQIRKIFEFESLKGATYSARWGFSVDFVPLLAGRRLSLKQSSSKAQLDLCIDPIDDLGSVPDWCSFLRSSSSKHRRNVALAAFTEAKKDFEAIASVNDICTQFDIRSKMTFRRFALSNYIQTDLAWGLCLVACGDEEAAQSHIHKFCKSFEIDRDTPALLKALANAREFVPVA